MSIYKADGVDVQAGDDFSTFAARTCQKTYDNSRFVHVYDFSHEHFRGPRGFRFKNLPDGAYIDIAADGVGTKTGLGDALGEFRTFGHDIIAMTAGDITRWGGIPLVFSNVLDVSRLSVSEESGDSVFRELLEGLQDAADKINVVLYRGETAELGPCVGSENPNAQAKFNWAGFMIGAYHPERIITGDKLCAGDLLIALREYGFRSNGLSTVRKAFCMHFGPEWWENPDAKNAIRHAAYLSTLYDKFLGKLNGWAPSSWFTPPVEPLIPIHAIAHITGGGIKSKLAKDLLFPRGLSAELYNLWEPPDIMRDCAVWRGLTDTACYSTWNCGQGVIAAVAPGDAQYFIDCAKKYDIEARVCGKIMDYKLPRVSIASQFSKRTIEFRP